MMTLKQGLRFLRQCGTVGAGEAKRRLREKEEDARIRAERARDVRPTEEERAAQEGKVFPREICFDVFFYGKEGREAERSLIDQTIHPYRQVSDAEIRPEDYLLFMEPDGQLDPRAVYELTEAINEEGADLIYTDEDFYEKEMKDLKTPDCKPDWGPDTARGFNLLGPLLVCSAALMKECGYSAEQFAGLGEDGRWDAALELAEKAKKILHIPRILYYRKAEGGKIPAPALRRVKDEITGEPLVSILIPNKDHKEDLKRCVDSIREKTTWKKWEIVVIENNSTEEETFRYYEELKQDERIRVITREGGFNFSALNNLGFREAKGEQILLLNNDTEVISPDWIQEMLMYTQREDVGAAGAKLYYPDGTIQHGGIGIGLMMLAGHYHKGFPGDSDGYFGRLKYAQNVSAVTAACVMIPRKVYEAVGGLDESFPVVFNDVDLCLKIREAGYLIAWTPWAELTHYESKSRGPDEDTKKKKRFFVRETNRFLRRWYRALEKGDPYYNPNLTRWGEDFSPRG